MSRLQLNDMRLADLIVIVQPHYRVQSTAASTLSWGKYGVISEAE